MKKQFVYCTFNKEGYHYYPGADVNPGTATNDKFDVSHLAFKHMHYFYFKVWVQVHHDDRDIEFIQLRRWIEELYDSAYLSMDNQSCEMMSDALYTQLCCRYPNSEIRIDISEENINGSYTEYTV